MADKYYGVVVTFDKPIHEDDFEGWEKLLGAIRGVASIKPLTDDFESEMAKDRAKTEIINKIWGLLK